jgi:hypothetical protein
MMEDIIDSATPLEQGLMNQRPRLFLTPVRMNFLRTAILSPPYASFFSRVKSFADQGMAWPMPPDWSKQDCRGYGCLLPHLAMTFLWTGNASYRDHVLKVIRSAATVQDLSLLGGHMLFGAGVAYDWLYESLSPSEREEMAEFIQRQGSDVFEHLGGFEGWIVNALTCNHLAVQLAGMMSAGAALYGERPNISRWLKLCVEKARAMASALGPDGASQEGVGYGQYYNEFLIKSLILIKELMGVDLLKNNTYLRNLPLFYLYSSLPRGVWTPQASSISFGDGIRGNWYGPDTHLCVLAALYRDERAQWQANQHHAAGTAGNTAAFLNLTHYDSTVAARAPADLPTSHHFTDKDIVFMRSGWEDDAAILAFKCGPHFGHHALEKYTAEIGGGHMRPNAGSFYLTAGGDFLISGDGYFRKMTHFNNTYILNGQGQEGEGGDWFESLSFRQRPRGPRILSCRLGDTFEYAIGDLAPAYPESLQLRRALRRVFYLRPRIWVLADEIEAAQPMSMEALFHSDFEFVQEGSSWVARGNQFAVRLTCRATVETTATTERQPFCHTSGKITHHIPVLRIRAERQSRYALLTMVEILPAKGSWPDVPELREESGRFHLAWARLGFQKKALVDLFQPDLSSMGWEFL